jgi:hypothetical protein
MKNNVRELFSSGPARKKTHSAKSRKGVSRCLCKEKEKGKTTQVRQPFSHGQARKKTYLEKLDE